MTFVEVVCKRDAAPSGPYAPTFPFRAVRHFVLSAIGAFLLRLRIRLSRRSFLRTSTLPLPLGHSQIARVPPPRPPSRMVGVSSPLPTCSVLPAPILSARFAGGLVILIFGPPGFPRSSTSRLPCFASWQPLESASPCVSSPKRLPTATSKGRPTDSDIYGGGGVFFLTAGLGCHAFSFREKVSRSKKNSEKGLFFSKKTKKRSEFSPVRAFSPFDENEPFF